MADIDIFMKENPGYENEDPQEIADFVYETEYKKQGVDRGEFDEFFLGQKQGIIPAIGRGISGVYNAAKDAVQGDAEHDIGNLNSIGAGNSASVGMASVFGDDEDYANAALEANPGSTLDKDKNDNQFLTLQDGQKGYINQPGLDLEDVTRFAGKAAAFIPAGKLAAMGGGLLARMGIGATATGVTDAAMQKASGREEVDSEQVAMSVALGGGAEAMAAPAGAALKWAKDRYKNWKGITPERRGHILAKRMGMEDMNKSQLKKLGEFDGKLVDAKAAIADSEFDYKLTKGQMMRDKTPKERASQFDQLSKEEKLRSSSAGQRFRDVDDANYQQTESNVDDIVSNLSGGAAQSADPRGAANIVTSELQNAAKVAKGGVNEGYDEARKYPLDFDGDWVSSLHGRIKARMSETDMALDELTPAANGALKKIKKLRSGGKKKGGGEVENFVNSVADEAGMPRPSLGGRPDFPSSSKRESARTSLDALDRMRRVVARSYDKALNNEDRNAVKAIRDMLDDEIDGAIDQGLFQGDGRAVEALKNARKLNRDYMKKFNSNDEAGKVVKKLLDEEVTPEQATQYLIGVNGLTKPGASRVIKKYAEAVGRDSDAFNAMRELTFMTLVKKPTGELKGHQHLVSSLRTALNGKGGSMMNELYSESELKKIQRFVVAVDKLVPKGDFAKSAGTIERFERFYGSTFKDTPLLGMASKMMDYLGVSSALKAPQSMPRAPLIETVGAMNAQ